ncbi:unnamed protein product [Bemisia tabaci]|uniref:Calcitonin receptor n=1 Tax=Bemisia tabaci TaxID=7038 RepID=A0A9P0AIS6_BEMTA|nr:PREDICTED: calcitonin gene-related peptide type 1 receptor [Bemisia tabaci]XP_018910932.1 PREDICTED: calcitonin gene-related peptide type 1 receptor [Bemisia tabaci]XP_018910933.1 PREDICTED: calcitonin gene-related peptide type 1 receptor [Bemisia tabaci]CAH0393747.1 unnamed protein product [Bemisia tabaci]
MNAANSSTALDMENWYLNLRNTCLEKIRRMQIVFPNDTVESKKYCKTAFDGWSCWNVTLAGETSFVPCPSFITGFDPKRRAFRQCLENGSWYKHPETGQSWSNYTTCIDVEDLKFRDVVNTLYMSGYFLSLTALLISLVIFLTFKSLRCTRIAIHVHLFTSFALNDLAWIIWYMYVVGDTKVLMDNPTWCRALHIALQYLMLANYAWMFCEGLHLHLALVVVFVKDDMAMRWFYSIGWGLPFIITAAYATIRGSTLEDTLQCWMNESHATWFLTVPVLVSLLASLGFLGNVLWVLLTKLHWNSANPAPIGLRKAVRATLILIPLFGVHHILLFMRPKATSPAEIFYELFSAAIVSLQGFCVSILFCFANVDVHGAFKASFYRLQRRGTRQNMTATTHNQSQSKDVYI